MLASDGDGGPVGAGGPLGLTETLRRSSLRPAELLYDHVPSMRRKGRMQQGCDADIVVFDPAAVSDQATYLRQHPAVDGDQSRAGQRHVRGARRRAGH